VPRATYFKTNFTAGELSPRLSARVDLARYANGARTLNNFYALVHGGAKSRQGLRFAAGAKNNDKLARLVPFVFSRTQAFIVEFGELYLRFYTPAGRIESAGVPIEVATPWDDTDLELLKYAQSRDTMFLAHPNFPMRKLVRFSNTSWKLSEVDWEVPPSEELGERPNTTLTLSAVSGAAVTATAGSDSFRASDVGRFIESGAGIGEITVFTSATQVTLNIAAADAFSSTGPHAANTWKITESPKTTLTPSATGPEGATITLTAGASAWKNFANNTHIGSFVEVNNGLVEITAFTTDVAVNGIVRTALASTTAAPAGGWALRQVQWNAVDGYPRAVGLWQQRLIAGGSPNYPNFVWGSRTGEYLNHAEGIGDDDAFVFPLASDQLDAVEHIAAAKALFPLTAGAEWAMFGGVEKPITPTNVQANPDTAYGADIVRPVRVGDDVIEVQSGGRKLRAISFRSDLEKFSAPDLTVLAEHITEGGIVDMAYAQNPDTLLWMVRGDGKAVTCSIERDQEVIGFATHETDGTFESFAVIPNGETSQVWALVKRTINGQTKRYVEFFEEGLETDCAVTGTVTENAITGAVWAAGVLTITRAGHGYATGDTIRLSGFTPSSINAEYKITVTGANTYTVPLAADPGAISVLGTDAKATKNWSGLSHIEAKTATIVADGYVAKTKTVTAGAIVLDKAAYKVEIGLGYTGKIVTLPPEVPTATGSAQGNAISIHEVVVRFHKTKGGKVNGQYLTSRKFGTGPVLDQPVPEFSGDKRVEVLGWGRAGSGDSDGSVTIERDQPLQMQVLGVVTKLTINDG
jgi:hypothetical protein